MIDLLNSKADSVYAKKTGSSGSGNNTICFDAESTSSAVEHLVFFVGYGANSQHIIFLLYFRASNGAAKITNLGDISATVSIEGKTCKVKASQYINGMYFTRTNLGYYWANT